LICCTAGGKSAGFLWQTINSNFSSGEGVNQRNY